MIGWMVRNFISREANVLKIYKILIRLHVEYCTQVWAPMSRHGNWSIMRFESTQEDKNNKKSKRLQL